MRPLARGGMGEVFEALALGEGGFERRVALKRVLPELSSDPGVRRAFLDEARIASRFHHGNIVQVTDYGMLDGTEFLVMEFVAGIHAGEASRRARSLGQGVPVGIALHVISEIAHALAYLHENGIVHRDVTPHNVLLSWQGDVKLSDFGIAGAIDPEGGSRRADGKRRYMAPEQASGGAVGGAADVWAAGATLHALFVDAPPERGEIDPEISDDVRPLLEECLREDPNERIAAGELADRAGELASRRLHRNGRGVLCEWLKAVRRHEERTDDARPQVLDLFVIPERSDGSRRFTLSTMSGSGSGSKAASRVMSPVLFDAGEAPERSTVPEASDAALALGETLLAPLTPAVAYRSDRGPLPDPATPPPARWDDTPPVELTERDRPSVPLATGEVPSLRSRGSRWLMVATAAVVLAAAVSAIAFAAATPARAGRAKVTAEKAAVHEPPPLPDEPEGREPPIEDIAQDHDGTSHQIALDDTRDQVVLDTTMREITGTTRREDRPSTREETSSMRHDPEEDREPVEIVPSAPAWLRIGGAGLMHGTVIVDGRGAGHAPVELPLPAGSHHVIVRAPDGAVLLDQTVTLGAQHTRANALRIVR